MRQSILLTLFHYQRVAGDIQTVMAQHTIQIGLGRFRRFQPQIAADPGEKFPPALSVESCAQLLDAVRQQGPVVEKQIRTMQAYIIHSPEPFDGSADVTGHGAEHLTSKTIVGISCGHWGIHIL